MHERFTFIHFLKLHVGVEREESFGRQTGFGLVVVVMIDDVGDVVRVVDYQERLRCRAEAVAKPMGGLLGWESVMAGQQRIESRCDVVVGDDMGEAGRFLHQWRPDDERDMMEREFVAASDA